jgi:plasmid stabilization system protein ParE
MRVFWTPGARLRLREIEAHISKERSPQVARDVAVRIIRHTLTLEEPPLVGKRLRQYADADVRELYEAPYRIVFRVVDDRIEILTVLHFRQLLPSDLRDLELHR